MGDSAAARPGTRILERLVAAVAVFSVAGGVGKTSLVAALGRVLAGHGEQVLLGETASAGLVPLYFGSRESKPGVVRTFTPPAGSANAPIHAVTLAAEEVLGKGSEKDSLAEILLRDARDSNRILVDVQTASKTIVEGLLPLAPTVLVPLLPDLNSVMTIASVEEIFAGREAHAGRATEPVYLLNQFDASLPLHADVRTILTQRLGSRLLPFVVRSSPAVSEALAEGMTVVDYAPESPVVEDYVRLANWLGSVSPVMQPGFSGVRWTER
ncbi:MAG TPA: cellulose synthase operon protein YhjQ/BcsQ [Acidobacteriaceae bacterium]|nr:cellulose synthase operon protein YhjQ/BcsQ [Acidobacteriaceae bacterium]